MAKVQQKSEKITAFGGIFFVLDKFDRILSSVIDSHLGLRRKNHENDKGLVPVIIHQEVIRTHAAQHCVGPFFTCCFTTFNTRDARSFKNNLYLCGQKLNKTIK